MPDQLRNRAPLSLEQGDSMAQALPVHQVVAFSHRAGIGDADRQHGLLQSPATALKGTEHSSRLAMSVIDIQKPELVRLFPLDRQHCDYRHYFGRGGSAGC